MNLANLLIGIILIAILFVITLIQYMYYKNNWAILNKESKEKRYANKAFPTARKFWINNGWVILGILTVLAVVTTATMAGR